MIGMRTILEVADNSGARRLQCILPRGGDLGLRAGLGDVITASVKEAAPDSAIKKGKVVRCVVVRMRKAVQVTTDLSSIGIQPGREQRASVKKKKKG